MLEISWQLVEPQAEALGRRLEPSQRVASERESLLWVQGQRPMKGFRQYNRLGWCRWRTLERCGAEYTGKRRRCHVKAEPLNPICSDLPLTSPVLPETIVG